MRKSLQSVALTLAFSAAVHAQRNRPRTRQRQTASPTKLRDASSNDRSPRPSIKLANRKSTGRRSRLSINRTNKRI